MNFRRPCLWISLLAVLAASGVSPVAAAEVVLFLPSSDLAIPIGLPNLRDVVCQPPKEAIVECHVIVKAPPEHLALVQEEGAPDSGPKLAGGNVITTPCGVWDAELSLDPARLQPASPLFFLEVSGDPGYGVPAVVLEHRPSLRLANHETGQTANFALRPMPGLASSWTLASTVESPAPIPGAQRVITFENCFPQWVFENSRYEVIPDPSCPICPDSDDGAR